MKRCAICYSRVSTSRQAENGQSLEQQHSAMKLYCQLHEFRIVKHFVETKSAIKMENRPELAAAIDLACARAGLLVVWKLDRLTRSAGDLERLTERLRDSGADLASVTEFVNTSTASGRCFLGMSAVFSRYASELTGERVKATNSLTVKANECDKWPKGHRTQGTQPAGYLIVDGKRVVCEPEMEIVREIQDYAARGMGPNCIAVELNDQEYPTIGQMRKWPRAAKHWHPNVVKKILAQHLVAAPTRYP